MLSRWFERRNLARSGVHYGHGCLIDRSVIFRDGTRIEIGDECEIKRNCLLDGRSHHARSIKIGASSRVKDSVAFMAYHGYVHIGANCIIQRGTSIFGHGGTVIGDGVIIGANVIVAAADYALKSGETPFVEQGYASKPVRIENNVFLGSGVIIMPGSLISEGVVVGANSVVSGSLNRSGLYVGAPARFKRPLLAPSGSDEFMQPSWGR